MKQLLLRLKNKQVYILICIVILGGLLRFYKLNQVPAGFYWDEAAIAYNAWGISVWNRDEFGNKLPISFKSFGDYKAPLFIYTLAAVYKITGLHPEYVRVLSAICGLINILLMYLLSKSIFSKSKHKDELRLLSAGLMAVVPWAINFSRIGSEAEMALTLVLAGCIAFTIRRKQPLFQLIGIILFGLSLYTYHSTKIFLPLFMLGCAILFIKRIKQIKWSYVVAGLVLLMVMTLPLASDMIKGEGFERGKIMIMYQNGVIAPASVIGQRLIQNISSYLSFSFWTMGQDAIGLRHNVTGHGVLYWTIVGLAILGIIRCIWQHKKIDLFLILWFIAGLMPSLISNDAPHAIRSMLALPAVIFIAVKGYELLPRIIKILSIILVGIEFTLYLSAYYGSYVTAAAADFQYGYKEAILYVDSITKENDKVIMTSAYGQPYIYTLLYRKITPEQFKFGALANYEFHPIKWPDQNPHRIFVSTPNEIPASDSQVIKVISTPDGSKELFVIAQNK